MDIPTELQLELMEEDNLGYGQDDLPPDEQQLEVLEDIWLKAGEMEADEASICDAGYKVNSRRKYFQKKKRNKDPDHTSRRSGSGSSSRKKREKEARNGVEKRIKSEPEKTDGKTKQPEQEELVDDLTGIYAARESKSKKVCGKIVSPIELLGGTDTTDLVKSLVAQETNKLLHQKKKKHKHKDHEKHKHKKRK